MSADIEQPTQDDASVAAPETPEPQAQATVERDVEQDTLEIPDSSEEGGKARYVPLSALEGARGELRALKDELKAAKEGSVRAQTLEARIDDLSQQLAQITPKAQAYDAALAAQQYQAPQEDDSEARELAEDLALYTVQGQLDIPKAQKLLA